MNVEIEKLKQMLVATREKNGGLGPKMMQACSGAAAAAAAAGGERL